MWAEAFILAALVVGLILWLTDVLSGRSPASGRTGRNIEPVLSRVARSLGGELVKEPLELRFEIEGSPASVRAEPDCAVLRIDLSCLRGAHAVRELCARWVQDRPSIAGCTRATLEALSALRSHRYAPAALRLRRHELCMAIGRVPTARRILGCADFARQLVPLLMRAALEASRPRQAYR